MSLEKDISSKRLKYSIKYLYEPTNTKITMHPVKDKNGLQYNAYYLGLNYLNVIYRSSKITPIKIGQFIAVWKKVEKINKPYSSTDDIDILIVDVSENGNLGQFVFNKDILIKKGIMSHGQKMGKMGFRVYPPWIKPIARQAILTQKWQVNYFVSYNDLENINLTSLLKK